MENKNLLDLSKLPFKTKWVIDHVIEIQDEAAKEIAAAKTLAQVPKILPYEQYNINKVNATGFREKSFGYGCAPIMEKYPVAFSHGKYNEIADSLERIAEFKALDEEVYQRNLAISKNNFAAKEWILRIYKEMGINTRVPKKTRSIVNDYKDADFVTEVIRQCSVIAPYTVNGEWETVISKQKEIANNKRLKEQREKDEASRKEKEKAMTAILFEIATKYGMKLTAAPTVEEVEEMLLGQDEYLNLAVAMLNCRNDHSEYKQVRRALDQIGDVTPCDKEIIECVGGLLNPYDGDGRCFRDCEYSYDVLFGYAEAEVRADYDKIQGLK